MNLAIIVSGILRNMKNASGSWNFNGDYHLVTENNIYRTQTKIIENKLTNNLNIITDCLVEFKTINIIMDTNIHDISDVDINTHPILNMVWKWKLAYYNILPYYEKLSYDRILIIRPDMYISNLDFENKINNIEMSDNEIHTIHEISFSSDINGPWMGDMFMLMNLKTLNIISLFYDYCLDKFKNNTKNKNDIHNLLAEYVIKNNITVTDKLKDFYSFFTFRSDISDYMFNNGKLDEKYTHHDVAKVNNDYIQKIWKNNQ
jgi:hypothetical protein